MQGGGNGRFQAGAGFSERKALLPEERVKRIGSGALGGKAQGLVDIHQALRNGLDAAAFPGIAIDIRRMTILGGDVFATFMERNHLLDIACSDLHDGHIARAFQKADLPCEILGDLRALVGQMVTPLAIRSSSLLEDSEHEPFAGVYATKMIPNGSYSLDIRFRQLVEAIKFVYSSTFYRAAKNYRRAIGRADEDEKMAMIVQEMVGKRYRDRFYPDLSGVARSYNYYPMAPARPEDGVVSLALGMGKTIVDGGISWTYSPGYPKVDPPFGSTARLLKNTQTQFWAVNMGDPPEYDPTRETEYLLLESITEAERDGTLRRLASTYNPQSDRLSIGTGTQGPRAITFAPLLVLKELPLNEIILRLLSVCEQTLGAPVEIEFAMTFDPHHFAFLQVRKMAVSAEEVQVAEAELSGASVLAASRNALGNGALETIRDVVYVKPGEFNLRYTQAMVPELKRLNERLLAARQPYLLVALGRLGTTDPWLGIPVQWAQICGAQAVVEVAQENARVELSQGSHYFHNIVNLGVKYFLMPFTSPYKLDWAWLERQPAVEETRFLRHVCMEQPLQIKVDGRSSRGVIYKPGERADSGVR